KHQTGRIIPQRTSAGGRKLSQAVVDCLLAAGGEAGEGEGVIAFVGSRGEGTVRSLGRLFPTEAATREANEPNQEMGLRHAGRADGPPEAGVCTRGSFVSRAR